MQCSRVCTLSAISRAISPAPRTFWVPRTVSKRMGITAGRHGDQAISASMESGLKPLYRIAGRSCKRGIMKRKAVMQLGAVSIPVIVLGRLEKLRLAPFNPAKYAII